MGPRSTAKTIVEHTAINPNKAAHIGHVRNSALGDTLVRVLRFRGTPVEVQNYIDDTGVQVADVVVGFRELEQRDLAAVRALAESTRFDYYCWDLYARVTEWYGADKERLDVRGAALHDIEHGVSPTADIAQFVAERIVRCHLRTMGRLNIDYNLLTWEGDILRLQFWARAFEVLKETGAVYLQTEGRLAGCWVMTHRGAGNRRSRGCRDRKRRGSGRARKGHRSFERDGDLRRQGHGLSVLEVGLAGTRLLLSQRSVATGRRRLCGRRRAARSSPRRRTRRLGPRRRPTTSSTCGRRTCRSC